MIKEAYCSFEVAKLLKEKGFTEECEYFYDWYNESESYHICSNGGTCNNEKYPDEYSMPTHQMACAWLREKHSILVTIVPQEIKIGVDKLCYGIYRITEDVYTPLHNGKMNNLVVSYEDTVEAALKYVLENLI